MEEIISGDDSLPDAIITDNDFENSDEEVNISDSNRIGNPFAGIHLDRMAQSSLLFPRVNPRRNIRFDDLEESKDRRSFVADWVRIGQRVIDSDSFNEYDSNESESSVDINLEILPVNLERLEISDVNSSIIKNLLECQIWYGQMRENLMCCFWAQTYCSVWILRAVRTNK